MKHRTLLAAVLAAGSLLGMAGVAQAVPAVVAGTGTYYPGTAVYPTQPNTIVVPGSTIYGSTAYNATVAVQPPPPAPLYEPVPVARAGYIWAPGHYEWRNGQYVWIGGEWMTARPGFAWRAGHWQQADNGAWIFVSGHWVRGDGYAYNNGRYNDGRWGPYGDRDGDGVINRDDAYPNDPSRY